MWARRIRQTPGAVPPALAAAALLMSCAEPTDPMPEEHRADAVAVEPAALVAKTKVTIDGRNFRINGALTYPGSDAEGGLMNVRMVNSVFEDTNRPTFNAGANTDEFVGRMHDYVKHGVRGFTVSFQGGFPGYEGARNSAFLKNGALKSDYLARMARVIERADALGAVVILSLYYQRQDQLLQDEAAVRAGVVNAVNWVKSKGYKNIVLEVVNEYGHGGFNHSILRSDAGVASLLRLAKDRYPALPVTASYIRNGQVTSRVGAVSDVITVHFNAVPTSDIPSRVKALRNAYPTKPIVCNEDERIGAAAAAAASATVGAGASYGLMVEHVNQHWPFDFEGRTDDPKAYDRYLVLTR
jgi:hypothetical protein